MPTPVGLGLLVISSNVRSTVSGILRFSVFSLGLRISAPGSFTFLNGTYKTDFDFLPTSAFRSFNRHWMNPDSIRQHFIGHQTGLLWALHEFHLPIYWPNIAPCGHPGRVSPVRHRTCRKLFSYQNYKAYCLVAETNMRGCLLALLSLQCHGVRQSASNMQTWNYRLQALPVITYPWA